ncbi:MAG: hypothetical protein CM15mP88_0930 [Pseudomonadota bacterium]|nr:MAG: hypothetical protein CM15mP88_0930 [Pseudomonadota bacterium]
MRKIRHGPCLIEFTPLNHEHGRQHPLASGMGKRRIESIVRSRLCEIRGKKIGMVFQEPMSALNPVQTIGHQVSESLLLHHSLSRHESGSKASGCWIA